MANRNWQLEERVRERDGGNPKDIVELLDPSQSFLLQKPIIFFLLNLICISLT